MLTGKTVVFKDTQTGEITDSGQVLESPLGTGLYLKTDHGIKERRDFGTNTKIEIIS